MMKKFIFLLCIPAFVFLSSYCKKDTDPVPELDPVDSLAFTDAEKALIFSGDRDSLMRVMNYYIYADSLVLRSHSKQVNLLDTATLFHLIQRMYVTVRDPQHPGVGIAAPQTGICRRVIWVQRYDKGTLNNRPFEVYLNPRITRYSDTTEMRPDGCLSIPGWSANSRRAIWVDVEYMLPDGSIHSERISHKYTAHIFQHEIDHLDGILFIDRLE